MHKTCLTDGRPASKHGTCFDQHWQHQVNLLEKPLTEYYREKPVNKLSVILPASDRKSASSAIFQHGKRQFTNLYRSQLLNAADAWLY